MFKTRPTLLTGFATLAALTAITGAAGPAAAGTGSIKGAVKLLGKAPVVPELNMKADPFCAKKPAKSEEVVVGPAGQLKNVVVRISKGATGTFPVPTKDVEMDQDGCAYQPRVVVAQAGQAVAIKNSDQTLHNVHTYKGPSTLFNQAQPQGFPPIKKKLPSPAAGDVIKFKCDVHPWMTGFVVVTDNPFWAITGADGAFTLDNIPPGTYTIEAWHERFGVKSGQITVAPDKVATTKFDFSAK